MVKLAPCSAQIITLKKQAWHMATILSYQIEIQYPYRPIMQCVANRLRTHELYQLSFLHTLY